MTDPIFTLKTAEILASEAKAFLEEQDRAATKSITEHYTPKKTYAGYEWVDSRGALLPASKIEVLLYEILKELRAQRPMEVGNCGPG